MLSKSVRMAIALLFLLLNLPAHSQQPPSAPNPSSSLPDAVIDRQYSTQLAPSSGSPPWTWQVISGSLPPGLALSPEGTLTGVPESEGTFQFQVQATDSASPPHTVSYDLTLDVHARLRIRWDTPPGVQSDRIEGSVEVVNHTEDPLDLTVVVLAVNEIGKAFALGYQHFNLAPGSQRIPFGLSLPRGSYVIHADAIGERVNPAGILHTRLETPAPLVVP